MLKRISEKSWFKSIVGIVNQFKSSKKDLLSSLPDSVLQFELANHLSHKELKAYSETSQKMQSLFKPVLDVRQFLHYVTRANYHAVEAMLKKDSKFLTQKGVVTDCSGRTFTNISGFEYALWAWDKPMWTRMLHCLPKDPQSDIPIIEQYWNIKEIGITYTFEGVRFCQHHFDFAIIDELEILYSLSSPPLPELYPTRQKQWLDGVGRAQRLFPMHVIFEYLKNNRIISVEPRFELTRRENAALDLNNSASIEKYWFDFDSHSKFGNLGIDFAIGRFVGKITALILPPMRYDLEVDLDEMRALLLARKSDFEKLELQLKHDLRKRRHYQLGLS